MAPGSYSQILSTLRSAVGVGSWVTPRYTARVFGLGSINDDPRAAALTRLFGVRDLALGQAVRHPDPSVRRAALQIGVVVDSIDVVASLMALRRGAPKVMLLTFAGGAVLFAGLGAAALAGEQATTAA